MKVAIITIGNSRGVRLPEPLLDQCGFADEAELSVKDGCIVLSPLLSPRMGWPEAFGEKAEFQAEDVAWLESPLE